MASGSHSISEQGNSVPDKDLLDNQLLYLPNTSSASSLPVNQSGSWFYVTFVSLALLFWATVGFLVLILPLFYFHFYLLLFSFLLIVQWSLKWCHHANYVTVIVEQKQHKCILNAVGYVSNYFRYVYGGIYIETFLKYSKQCLIFTIIRHNWTLCKIYLEKKEAVLCLIPKTDYMNEKVYSPIIVSMELFWWMCFENSVEGRCWTHVLSWLNINKQE